MLTLRDGQVVQKDWWHLADGDWGAGFFMNNACNFCDDVVAETADISFGDAWVEPYSSDGRGTNVVVVRAPVVEKLITDAIQQGRLQLQAVDGAFVAQTQAAGFRQRREGTRLPAYLEPKRRAACKTGSAGPEKHNERTEKNIPGASFHFCLEPPFFFSSPTTAATTTIFVVGAGHCLHLPWAGVPPGKN
jgi:coenzyme F420-reducing hydrogenase beta subunit